MQQAHIARERRRSLLDVGALEDEAVVVVELLAPLQPLHVALDKLLPRASVLPLRRRLLERLDELDAARARLLASMEQLRLHLVDGEVTVEQ
jgi:hypothetical protein